MKKLLLLLVVFLFGFFTHALITPDLFSRTTNLSEVENKISGNKKVNESTNFQPLTIVSFKNGSFHPGKVWIQKGYYLAIRNDDKNDQMWLTSAEKELSTIRGYGLSEQVKMRMDKEGTYQVTEKDTKSNLTVVVK